MKISIIICTYNRCKTLADTLNSYLTLHGLQETDAELLIVDNNSNDNTRQVTEAFFEKFRNVKYVFEPIPGLSQARNTGIRSSTGEIVVFVDDDVFFDPFWLLELKKAYELNKGVSCVGGKVVAHFEEKRPEWLADELLWVFAVTKYGDEEKIIVYPDTPIGCNMAFRREVFDIVGLFNTTLGRKGKNLLSGEENALFEKMHTNDMNVLYSPGMLINHRVFKERLDKNWIYKRFFWEGISEVVKCQSDIDKLTSYALAKKACKSMRRCAQLLRGGKRSPLAIYQWLKHMPVKNKAYLNYQKGIAYQCMASIFKNS